MTGDEAIEYIHSMVWDRRATGYEHARALLVRMGHPERRLRYVHVGGTNGKGSTACMLASILQSAGYRTGLYTSPYLTRFNERIRINGEEIPDDALADVTEYVKSCVRDLPVSPSEFALVCCVAFEYFARERCDIVVLEVGMGGDNDSTNVIPCPEVAVLTNIGLDHTAYLGDTLEEIARTKAGIIKEHGTVVTYPNLPSVEDVIRKACRDKKADLRITDFDAVFMVREDLSGQVFDVRPRKNLFLPLLGDHQRKNAAVALDAVDALKEKGWNISEENIRNGLENAKWPGRFEVLEANPPVIIDGGHNPQCVSALARGIREYLPGKKVIAITGVLADKDYKEMYRIIYPYVLEFICVTPDSKRALKGETLAAHLNGEGQRAYSCGSIREALDAALKITGDMPDGDGAIICFGSLYLVSDFKAGWRGHMAK